MTTDIPLAKDANGQPFDVDPEVMRWQVMRSEGPGRPMPAYDHVGDALYVDLHATHQELLRTAGPGRYRLLPVDAAGRVLAHLPTAVTGPMHAAPEPRNDGRGVTTELRSVAPHADGRGTTVLPALQPSQPIYNDLLSETVRANTRITEAMIAAVPLILTSAGGLLTSADGAKLTTRQPLAWPVIPPSAVDDDSDEDPPEAPPSGPPAWLLPLVNQVTSAVMPAILAKLKIPPESLTDWRKAVPPSAHASPSSASAPANDATERARPVPGEAQAPSPAQDPASASSHGPDVSTASPTQSAGAAGSTQLGPAALAAHVGLMYESLSPDEQYNAGQRVAALSPDERSAWLVALARLSVADGTARIRAELADASSPAPGAAL